MTATATSCSISSSLQGHYLIRWSFHNPRGLGASGVTRAPSLAQSPRCRELGLIWSVTLAPRPYRRRRPRPIIAGPASPPDYRLGCDSDRHVSRPLLPRRRCRSRCLPALQWVTLLLFSTAGFVSAASIIFVFKWSAFSVGKFWRLTNFSWIMFTISYDY